MVESTTRVRPQKKQEQFFIVCLIVTVYDIMNILCICRNTVYNLLGSGQIKGFKIGRTWRITQKALDDYLKDKYK